MDCPICSRSLQRVTLLSSNRASPDLRGFECPDEHGVFIPSDLYFAWYESGPEGSVSHSELNADEVGDVKRAKLCPQDGRIMARYRTAAEDGYWIDRCGTCGGIWFDGAEWQATVALGLHDQLPRVFSDAWQREIEEQTARETRRARLASALGNADLDRVDEVRDWVWAHPQRHLLLARLNDRPAH